MIEIGLRIKDLRKNNNLTQEQLGELLKTSHSTINRWEKGKSTPNHNQINTLAKFLKTTPSFIAFGEEISTTIEPDEHPIIPPIPKGAKNIVAFQGEMGAYSNLACCETYPNAEYMPCTTFKETFEAVEKGIATYAVIPIENSLGGRVADIHHLLPEYDLHMVGEHYQPIEHCLLGVPGATIADIKSVYSHEQALSQCRENIHDLKITPVKYADTAGAANFISTEKDMKKGAIASKLSAEIYGLSILKENFEDKSGNTTRFVILSKSPLPYELKSDDIKTSCIFYTRNIPASLYKALGGFATNGIQIVKLESYVPMIKNSGEAHFYAEFNGGLNDKNVKLAFAELEFYTNKITILGSYKKN